MDELLIDPLLDKYSDTLPTLKSFPNHLDKEGKTRITLPKPFLDAAGNKGKLYDCIPKEEPSITLLFKNTKFIER